MLSIRTIPFILIVFAVALSGGIVAAQQKPNVAPVDSLVRYDAAREVTLVGTVQSYTSAAQTAPLGPHLTLQTNAGIVDVHLGDARLLAANHFNIQTGDSLRIIGENVAYGNRTQFVARIIQKGTQALQVRSIRGIPLSYMAPRTASESKQQGGVL
jgi:hypothetical protein